MTVSVSVRVIRWLCKTSARVSSVCLLILIGVLTFSAVERYLFANPVANAEEICALLFIAVAFLGLGDSYLQDRHIRVGRLTERLPPPLRKSASLVGSVLSVAALTVLLLQTWSFAAVSFEVGSQSQVGDLILWPWMALIPLGIGLLILAIVAGAAEALLTGNATQEEAEQSRRRGLL